MLEVKMNCQGLIPVTIYATRNEINKQRSFLEHGMRSGFTKRHCPKCNGNIFINRDESDSGFGRNRYGWDEWCLQCGYTHHVQPGTVLTEEPGTISTTK